MLLAVAVKTVVGPAFALAEGWTPKGLAPNRADHTADDCARRTGNKQSGSGAGCRADQVRTSGL